MRNIQNLTSKHRVSVASAICMEPGSGASKEWVAAAADALNDMGKLVSHQCFTNPESLTQDRIIAYALALMRLRECACAAGLERLTNACDALAITVSRLLEDRGCACLEKCASLTRFIVHADTMIKRAL